MRFLVIGRADYSGADLTVRASASDAVSGLLVKLINGLNRFAPPTKLARECVERVVWSTFMVLGNVIGAVHYNKIFNPVVKLVLVFVMHNLIVLKRPPYFQFANEDMKFSRLATELYDHIPRLYVDAAASIRPFEQHVGSAVTLPAAVVHPTPTTLFRRLVASVNHASHDVTVPYVHVALNTYLGPA